MMKKPEEVHITNEDFSNLVLTQIGQGLDAKVYRTKKKVLFKIYHNYLLDKKEMMTNVPVDEEGVRIFRRDNFRKNRSKIFFQEKNDSDIKFITKELISRAVLKKDEITLSTLPQALLYVDHHFKGCILKDFSWSTSILNVRYLPYSLRIYMAKQILIRVKELLNHHIYPVDLAMKNIKNSNVLWNFPLTPEIIDLDGRSTLYPNTFHDSFYKESIFHLNCLLMEILFGRDESLILSENLQKEDILNNCLFLEQEKVPSVYIDGLASLSLSLTNLEKFLKVKER